MKIAKSNKRNNLLNANLAWIELAIVETKQKLEEIIERLKIIEEKNLELHVVIFEIDC
jgi:hypothetical protein